MKEVYSMQEKWLPYEKDRRFEVSSLGKVRKRGYVREYSDSERVQIEPETLSPSITSGYEYIRINGQVHKVHRMVAETFLPNPNNYPMIKHKDGNIKNNSVENLEWTNPSPNIKSVVTPGLKVKCLEDGKEFKSIKEASQFYDLPYDKLYYLVKHEKPYENKNIVEYQ